MSAAAAALAHLKASGVRLELSAGSILATPREALTDTHRALIRAHKGALVSLLTGAAEAARRLWTITLPDGSRFSSSFTPPATRAEISTWYPSAITIEPDPDDSRSGPSDPPT